MAPCAPGLLCILDADQSKPGICDEPRAAGQPCIADKHCASGLACFDRLCAPALGLNQNCKSGSKCLPHLMCSPWSETCTERQQQGEPCYLGGHCAEGLACTPVSVGQVCVPGAATDGDDTPGLPTLGQPCTDRCARWLKCLEGPLAGECLPTLCVAVLQSTP